MPDSKYRFFILKILAACMLAAIIIKLFGLQIMDGGQYLKVANSRLSSNIVSAAPRGDILDCYGNVLVTNKTGYSIVLRRTNDSEEQLNKVLLDTIDILIETGGGIIDNFPISQQTPYEFVFEDKNSDGSTDDEKSAWFKANEYNDVYISEGMRAEDVLYAYMQIYNINGNMNSERIRALVAVRYEADINNLSSVNPVKIAKDINVGSVTRIKEAQDQLNGISISEDYVRVYNQPGLATHILGRTGKISPEEYKKNAERGYGMNDDIGKQGIERWAEQYLRGVNGTIGTTTRIDGSDVVLSKAVDPVPGNYVLLTIDSELQRTLEQSLEKTIKDIGNDCNAGAAVVLDVNTGNTLAIGSYPTYDMSQFGENYAELAANESTPMMNRAVSGLYSPGSTFKPLTAIAGIQSGALSLADDIECTGIYRFYEGYQPTCWIWSEYHLTHGPQDVTGAIENSCNVFFYELGRRLGIDKLDEYARKFGLGEYTGIELTEETAGHMASPEYKEEVVENVIDSAWFGGDTLQAAIGQSYSLFTPVQLANYCATIANGGTRYKVNLIGSIRSSVDGSLVEKFEPVVEEKIDIPPQTLRAIHDGMKKVVDEGSASSIFEGYPIQVGGKTGTAQLGNGSNNAIFIAFAPFDNPQIAVAVVLEHGVRGTNASRVARDVFDKYFFGISNAETQTSAAR